MDCLPNEETLFESASKRFTLTTHRVHIHTRKLGAERSASLWLEHLASCELIRKPHPSLIVIGIVAAALALYLNRASDSGWIVAAGILVVALLAYLTTARRMLILTSCGHSIGVDVDELDGMKTARLLADKIEAAREARLALVHACPVPEYEPARVSPAVTRELPTGQATTTDARLAQSNVEMLPLHPAVDTAREQFSAELERFSAELKQLQAAAQLARERFRTSEERALLEIDRERTVAAKLHQELDQVRRAAEEATQRHRAEAAQLQHELAKARQALGIVRRVAGEDNKQRSHGDPLAARPDTKAANQG